MKKIRINRFVYILAGVLSITSCTNQYEIDAKAQEQGAKTTITASQPVTRMTYVDGTPNGVIVKWASTDKFKVFGNGAGEEFALTSGNNETSAVFEGTMPATPDGSGKYYAFYPSVNAPTDVWTNRVFKLTGQTQSANNDPDHLSDFDYMTGEVTTTGDGKANVDFEHEMLIMKFVLTLPDDFDSTKETLDSLTISTSKKDAFTLEKHPVNSTLDKKRNSQTLLLNSSITFGGATKVLTAYMMMAPFSLDANNTVTFTLATKVTTQDSRGAEAAYQARYYDAVTTIGIGGKSYTGGNRYTATQTLSPITYALESSVATTLGRTYAYPVKVTNINTQKSYYMVDPTGNNTPVDVTNLDTYPPLANATWKRLSWGGGDYTDLSDAISLCSVLGLLPSTTTIKGHTYNTYMQNLYEALKHEGISGGLWLFSYYMNQTNMFRFNTITNNSTFSSGGDISVGSKVIRLILPVN